MKKNISTTAIALVSLGLMTSYAFAEGDRGDGGDFMNRNNGTSTLQVRHNDEDERDRQDRMGRGNGQGDNNNEMDDAEEQDNENSLHTLFTQMPDVKTVVNLPVIDSTKLVTYADIVTVLNQYKDAVTKIQSQENVTNVASSSLSAQEKAILAKLSNKHSNEFNRTSARTNEILSQIKDLTDVLTPLGTTAISTELNLKGLLVLQLNDFSSMINSLTNLVDTTTNIIDEETN